MTCYTPKFVRFAAETYKQRPGDIERWQHSSDPTLAALCRDIVDAAKRGANSKQ